MVFWILTNTEEEALQKRGGRVNQTGGKPEDMRASVTREDSFQRDHDADRSRPIWQEKEKQSSYRVTLERSEFIGQSAEGRLRGLRTEGQAGQRGHSWETRCHGRNEM